MGMQAKEEPKAGLSDVRHNGEAVAGSLCAAVVMLLMTDTAAVAQ